MTEKRLIIIVATMVLLGVSAVGVLTVYPQWSTRLTAELDRLEAGR